MLLSSKRTHCATTLLLGFVLVACGDDPEGQKQIMSPSEGDDDQCLAPYTN